MRCGGSLQARLREQERLKHRVSSPTRIYSSRPETPPTVMVDRAEGTSNSSKSAPVLQTEGRGVAVEHPRAHTRTHSFK